ncbi:MAG: Flp pilus assembly complex ATPase component TadA [Firmicutes bacterium]|nr:Flp pilus assembly complex ATPase component TadA [Bacillota bacterium]
MPKKRLGEVLRERGKISEKDLKKIIEEQQGSVRRLGELLLERNLVDKADLVAALEEVTRVEYADCREVTPDPKALRMVPYAVAKKHAVLPVALLDDRLLVVIAEPQNVQVIDELRFLTGKPIATRLGFRDEILQAVETQYRRLGDPRSESDRVHETIAGLAQMPTMEFITTSARQSQRDAMLEFQAELRNLRTPAVQLVSAIIATAVEKNASDIHIEPQAHDTLVRIRVDGVLRELRRVPRSLQHSLTSRLKILADLDIAERRVPQDGSFIVQIEARKLDLRVSTLPTQYGEKVVIRILDSAGAAKTFPDLGLEPGLEASLKQILALPQGTLLVTGPTGSGKSTTLYAALHHLRQPGINIITVEDPIEYVVEGINQVQVNARAGLSFASVLRSILRQDPNVIMIGEIRDSETAEIALKAAQTGHLVLSTLHTNDSLAAITRLLDLGMPAYLIAASLSGVLAQRLVRRLCACRSMVPMSAEHARRFRAAGIAQPGEHLHVPVGCSACDQTGYKGRVGVYELLVVDAAIRDQIRSNARPEELRALARSNGFRRMQEDALEKVGRGLTTLEEVTRVLPLENSMIEWCRRCARELHAAFQFCPFCGEARTPTPTEERVLSLV